MTQPTALEVPPPRETVRLSGPLALVGAVPVLMGFHPARSLVLLCVHGIRHRVGPALRIDLPIPADEAAVVTFLAAQAARHATAVMLICYSPADNEIARGRTALPHARLVADCVRGFEDTGVPVIDAVLVRGGAAWSYLGHPASAAGSPLPADDDPGLAHLHAAAVGAGRAVLNDRKAIGRTVAAPSAADAAVSEAAVTEAFGRLAVTIADLDFKATVQVGCDLAHARLAAAVTAFGQSRAGDDAVWADLVVVLTIDLVRDAVISWCLERTGEIPVGLFAALARWVGDDFAVPVLAVLALVAYRSGDGALANVALERALAVDPEYRLAILIREFVVNGVHPTELDSLIIAWADHPANPAAPFWFRRLLDLDAAAEQDLDDVQPADTPTGTDGRSQ
ncbi:DUF4192 domain-containing protein [Nakamurella deserti]|uniref:DUF4192 domain-containing protein n=1 Tax=Nakamurella deserti TaxID=2164074 RepID=UPI000DBE3374|nr:DUF4192 domain-containing protein [Nakamurella deserti]